MPINLQALEKQRLPPVVNNPALTSSTLFQKFRLQQEADQLQKQPKSINISSSVEKKRRLLFSSEHENLLDKTSLSKTTNMQQESGSVKVCARCRTSNSPEWRRGPDGHKT